MNENNYTKCRNCGADVTPDSVFCSTCGSKIEHSANESSFCPNCSAEVAQGALFCSKCGHKLSAPNLCPNCAAPIERGANFCAACGTMIHGEAGTVQPKPKKPKKAKKASVIPLIRNCILVLVSVIMLIFSFMSVATYDLSLMGMEADIKLSPMRTTVIFFDTFKDLDADELMESDLYDDVEKASKEFYSEVVGGTADIVSGLFGLENTDAELSPAVMANYDDFYISGGNSSGNGISDDVISEDSISDYDIFSMLDDPRNNIKLSKDAEKALEKLMYLSLRLEAQGEEIKPTASGAVTMLTSLAFVALSIAFFAVSVINLLLGLFGKSAPTKSALRLLPTIPLMAVIAYFSCSTFFTSGGYYFITTKMGVATVVALIAGAIGVVACITLKIVTDRSELSLRGIITHSVSFAAAIAVICLVFAPVMTTTVKARIGSSLGTSEIKTSIGSDYFEDLNLGEEVKDAYDDARPSDTKKNIEEMLTSYNDATKADIKDGKLKFVNQEIMTLTFSALGGGTLDFCSVFALVPVLLALSALAAALVAWQSVCYFTVGKSMKSVTIPAKILTILCAMAAVALVIVFCAIINFNIKEFTISGFECSFAATSIILVVMSLITAAAPMLNNKKHDDDEYLIQEEVPQATEADNGVQIF